MKNLSPRLAPWRSPPFLLLAIFLTVAFVFSACVSLPFVNLDDRGYLGGDKACVSNPLQTLITRRRGGC